MCGRGWVCGGGSPLGWQIARALPPGVQIPVAGVSRLDGGAYLLQTGRLGAGYRSPLLMCGAATQRVLSGLGLPLHDGYYRISVWRLGGRSSLGTDPGR